MTLKDNNTLSYPSYHACELIWNVITYECNNFGM